MVVLQLENEHGHVPLTKQQKFLCIPSQKDVDKSLRSLSGGSCSCSCSIAGGMASTQQPPSPCGRPRQCNLGMLLGCRQATNGWARKRHCVASRASPGDNRALLQEDWHVVNSRPQTPSHLCRRLMLSGHLVRVWCEALRMFSNDFFCRVECLCLSRPCVGGVFVIFDLHVNVLSG